MGALCGPKQARSSQRCKRKRAGRGVSPAGGPAGETRIRQPRSVQFSPNGDLSNCDIGNHVIGRGGAQQRRGFDVCRNRDALDHSRRGAIQGTLLKGPRSVDSDRNGDLWLATREGKEVFRSDLQAGNVWWGRYRQSKCAQDRCENGVAGVRVGNGGKGRQAGGRHPGVSDGPLTRDFRGAGRIGAHWRQRD